MNTSQLIQEIRNGRKYLVGANLSWANLSGTDLSLANLREADLRSTNLIGADLTGANLIKAYLTDADFSGANLTTTILPNGQIYEEYLKTLPELFTATGRKFEEIVTKDHWNCHQWNNCPMAAVFEVCSLQDIPAIWQEKAQDFITYFDARMLPFEIMRKLK